MASAYIMNTKTNEYLSGWTILGTPRFSKNKRDAARMLNTAAKRVASNLNESERTNVFVDAV